MIFEQYTYKVKIKALAVVFALLLCAAYKRSFSPLIGLVKEHYALAEKHEELKKGEGSIDVIQDELHKIDRIIGKESPDKEKIQQDIISFTVLQKENVSIFDMQSIHQYADENYTVYTNQLDVTGNVNSLLSLAYGFEKDFPYSRLLSIRFYTVKKNNNPTVLHLKMLFQNYENNK